jgi:hypothetical protein
MSKTFEKLSINSFPAGSSLGLDGMRPQYLKDIIFLSAGEAGQQALRALTKLCNFLLSGQLPSEICHLLYAGSLCVLHKKDGGIRPIAIGNCLRRLTLKLACFQSRNIVNSYLSPHQFEVATKLSFKEDGIYPPIGVDYDFLCSRFNFTPLKVRRVLDTVTFLFKLFHNNVDCSSLLSGLCISVPQILSRSYRYL